MLLNTRRAQLHSLRTSRTNITSLPIQTLRITALHILPTQFNSSPLRTLVLPRRIKRTNIQRRQIIPTSHTQLISVRQLRMHMSPIHTLILHTNHRHRIQQHHTRPHNHVITNRHSLSNILRLNTSRIRITRSLFLKRIRVPNSPQRPSRLNQVATHTMIRRRHNTTLRQNLITSIINNIFNQRLNYNRHSQYHRHRHSNNRRLDRTSSLIQKLT